MTARTIIRRPVSQVDYQAALAALERQTGELAAARELLQNMTHSADVVEQLRQAPALLERIRGELVATITARDWALGELDQARVQLDQAAGEHAAATAELEAAPAPMLVAAPMVELAPVQQATGPVPPGDPTLTAASDQVSPAVIVDGTGQGAIRNGPRPGSTLNAPYLRDFVTVDDFKLPTDTDDTSALQKAANAAVAAGMRLWVPRKLTLSSTVTFQSATAGHPQFTLDIDAGRGADQTGTAGQAEWTWAGPNNTSMIRAINLIKSTWQGIHLTWPDTASGIVGYDLDQMPGGSGVTANITGNTFIACNVNIGLAANATGWRFGENAPSGGNITSQSWLNCNFNTQDMSLAGTAVGWRVMGANALALFWYGCAAAGCQLGFTSEKDAGGGSDGAHSFYFYGMSNTHNQTDFQFRGLGSYAIVGGRFEVGYRFLDEQLGSTGSDNFDVNITVSGAEIAAYTPADGVVFQRTTGGVLRLESVRVNGGGGVPASPYGSAMISLQCRAGAYGVLDVSSCSLYATATFYRITTGSWSVYLRGNVVLDVSQRVIGGMFQDSGGVPYGKVIRSGNYDGPDMVTLLATVAPGNGVPTAAAFVLAQAITIAAMGVNIGTIGDVGSTVALAIWSDDGTNRPGALFYSPGSVAGDGATGYKELTGLSQPLPAGKYWVGTVTQNVTTTAPKMYGSNSACFPAPQSGNGNTASSTMLTGWQGTNIGNAPVGAFTVAGIIQQNPKVVIKAA